MLEVDLRAGCDRPSRQVPISAPQRLDQLVVQKQRGAVVPLVVGVIESLLDGRSEPVGKRWIEDRLDAVDASHEISTAHEHDPVAVANLAGLPATPRVTA